MSKFHEPDKETLSDNDKARGASVGTCPICGEEMNPKKLRNHIGEHGENDE